MESELHPQLNHGTEIPWNLRIRPLVYNTLLLLSVLAFLPSHKHLTSKAKTFQGYHEPYTTTYPKPNNIPTKNLPTTTNKMHFNTIFISLFITLGLSLPMFPNPRPYIPSGMGTLPLITTSDFVVARASPNDVDDEVVIPDKWRHTHGKLFEETKAEKLVVQKRDLGDCKEGMWGC